MNVVPSGWVTVLTVFIPIIFASFISMCLLVLYKRANRADGRPELSSSHILLNQLTVGFVLGSLTQWCLGGIIYQVSNVATNDIKMMLLASLSTGILSLAMYHSLRGFFKKRNPGMYKFLTVKHRTAQDLGLHGDYSDMTIKDSELGSNRKEEE
tara:strand:+ start:2585 stop:3046 length:462 start_codon:yes stop_codon:yes gene_type:complete